MVVKDARERFGGSSATTPAGVVFAPGRVNLVGEHTDYNDGFVLPMGVDRGIALAFAPRTDDVLRVHSAACPQTRELPLDRLRHRVSVEPTGMVSGADGSATSPASPGRCSVRAWRFVARTWR